MSISRREFARMTGGLMMASGAALSPLRALAGESSSDYIIHHGAAPFYAAHLIPGSSITLSEKALREAGKKIIALTFDDGPAPANDTEILRLLAQYNAVATFFVIGSKAVHHVDLLQEMVSAGCEIGNHTWRHPMLTTLSAEAQRDEMRQTNELLAHSGVPLRWFRPPYGDYDQTTMSVAQGLGLDTVLWSVDSRDWKGAPPDELAQRVIGEITPGAVILMHSTKTHTVAALPKILEYAKANGYRLVNLSEWKQIMIQVDPVANRVSSENKATTRAGTPPGKVADNVRSEAPKSVR